MRGNSLINLPASGEWPGLRRCRSRWRDYSILRDGAWRVDLDPVVRTWMLTQLHILFEEGRSVNDNDVTKK